MSRPNFTQMTLAELKAYMLAHRDDTEAFHAYMDRSDAQRPVLAVLEPDERLTPEALERIQQERTRQQQG